jgi:exopolyphosphatase/pppGpp-phosphohydrolase
MIEPILERWVLRHLGKIQHERRVREIATKLFDLTGCIHSLDAHDRRVLCCAALVHDVGRAVDDRTHPTQGARLIERHPTLPLDAIDRRRLIYLTQYHRGAVPELGYDDILRPGDGRRATRLLLALLRTADALDSRQHASPLLSFSLKSGRLKIDCELGDDSPKVRRAYRRPKKYRLLEDVLDVRVQLEIRTPETADT